MRDDRGRLEDILESIERIERYAARGRRAFEEDELIQTWVVHHIEILGEAARAISKALQAEHPAVPWSEIVGMRNLLVHEYFGIDAERVWATVEKDLPRLKDQLAPILQELKRATG